MYRMRWSVALVAAVLVFGCAPRVEDGVGAAPDWVAGNPAEYPRADYLIGRGQGPTAVRARDRARADLAKIFEVAIEEVTRDVQAFQRLRDEGKSAEFGELAVERRLWTRTDRVLEGVEIAEQWRDPDGEVVHALAVMPRARAVRQLRAEIRTLDDATQRAIQRARGEGDLLARIDAASRAVAAQQQRAALQRQLRAVDPSGRGVAVRWALDRLVADRDRLRAQLRVRVQPQGADRERLARIARTTLGDAGLRVVDDGEHTLRVVLDTNRLGPRDGWYWQIGTLSVELVDPEGVTRGGWRWPVKVAASEPALLERRLYQTVAERVEVGLARALAGVDGRED